MRRNIEVKSQLSHWERTFVVAKSIIGARCITFSQEDTFFGIPRGRLKLRSIDQMTWELIYYKRADISGPKLSNFIRFPIWNPDITKAILSFLFGIRGVVRKTRTLFLLEGARIHLDQVEDLGNFLEIEVLVGEESDLSAAWQKAKSLMNILDVQKQNLINRAYIDLLGKIDVPQSRYSYRRLTECFLQFLTRLSPILK